MLQQVILRFCANHILYCINIWNQESILSHNLSSFKTNRHYKERNDTKIKTILFYKLFDSKQNKYITVCPIDVVSFAFCLPI